MSSSCFANANDNIASRRNLLPFPIPAFAPPFLSQTLDSLTQSLCRILWAEQLFLRRARPELLAQPRLHCARVQRNTHRLFARALLQIDIQTLRELIDSRLAGPV